MSNSNLSQLSDLSGISKIHSSSVRPSDKADAMSNVTEAEASSSIREPASVPIADDDSKVAKAIASYEDAVHDRIKLDLIQELLDATSISDNNVLQEGTATKLREILSEHGIGKYLQLQNSEDDVHKDLTLLGITNLPKIQLSHDEKREIIKAVEKLLREKINTFITSYETQGGNIKELLKNNGSFGKSCVAEKPGSELMRWKDQTENICDEYYQDLLKCADLVYQWQQLKHINKRELDLKIARNLLQEVQVAEVQAKIAKNTCAVKMYKETPKTVEAFKLLSGNLDAKIVASREEIRKSMALKKAYDDVSNEDYDQVLSKYTEIQSLIKKKERLMEILLSSSNSS